jgi:hypothetical protein
MCVGLSVFSLLNLGMCVPFISNKCCVSLHLLTFTIVLFKLNIFIYLNFFYRHIMHIPASDFEKFYIFYTVHCSIIAIENQRNVQIIYIYSVFKK